MRKIVTGDELTESILKSLEILCDIPAMTLGPISGNVLVCERDQSPYITNDGVTIASNILSDDKVVQAILDIALEASLKTNELVGDGTTTTLVLLKAFYVEGLKLIKQGKKRMLLKKEMEDVLEKVVMWLSSYKHMPTLEEFKKVAMISSSSTELGNIVFEVMQKVKRKGAIHVLEGMSEHTYYEMTMGYSFEIEPLADSYFMKSKEIVLNNVFVFLFQGYLEDLEFVSDLLNECIIHKKPLLFVLEGLGDGGRNTLLSLGEEYPIYFVEIPNYFSLKCQIFKDLEVLTGSQVFRNINNVLKDDVKEVSMVKLTKDTILFSVSENLRLKQYVLELEKELEMLQDDYQKELLEERIYKLQNGMAFLYVGGVTKAVRREKKMRVEDAICALESAKEGVLPGSGVSLLLVSSFLDTNDLVEQMFWKVMQKPFERIMENASLDGEKIKQEIVNHHYKILYNVLTHDYESMENCTVYDSYKVLEEAMVNAVSIASMLLTMEALIVAEKDIIKQIEI